MNYADSEFAQSINILKIYLHFFRSSDREVILQSIDEVEKSFVRPSYYSAYQGDFTPWNSYIVN